MNRKVQWDSVILPILFAIFIPLNASPIHIVGMACDPNGWCTTIYDNGAIKIRCVYPELGCSVQPSGDVQ